MHGRVREWLRSNVVALSSPASHDHAEPTSATWWLTFAKTHTHASLSDTPFKKDAKIQYTNEIALHKLMHHHMCMHTSLFKFTHTHSWQ